MTTPIPHIDSELVWGGHVAPGTKSLAVIRIQEWLTFHDIPVTIDGVFGKKTQQALAAFFHRPIGAIDNYLFAQLSAPLRRAVLVPSRTSPETLDDAVLQMARQHCAQKPVEIGGPNMGPWVRHYMRNRQGAAQAWCAGFVSTVWLQGARWMGLVMDSQYTTSCDVLAHRAQDELRFLAESPQTPEILLATCKAAIFVVRKSLNDWHHAGIAFDFGPSGFRTFEGNTNDGGSREGVKACERFRAYSGIDFIRFLP